MVEIKSEIEIRATAARVWAILTDFAAHPQWNPFVRSISGKPAVGQTLTVSVHPPGGKGMTFRPKVLIAEPNRELRWRGRLLLPGIFDGEHYFQICESKPGIITFLHGEQFSGLLVPLARSGLESGTKAGFEAMNQALKKRAEEQV